MFDVTGTFLYLFVLSFCLCCFGRLRNMLHISMAFGQDGFLACAGFVFVMTWQAKFLPIRQTDTDELEPSQIPTSKDLSSRKV